MKRKLITGERLMYVNGQGSINCTFTVKVRGCFTEMQVNAALQKLQVKHFLLRCNVQEDKDGTPWFVEGNPAPRIPVHIVHRTSDHQWQDAVAGECKQGFVYGSGPLVRLTWLRSEAVQEFIWVCAHCICDGISLLNLVKELLGLLDGAAEQMEPYEPFLHVRDIVPAAMRQKFSNKIKGAVFSRIARLFFLLKPATQYEKGDDYFISWQLDKALTDRINKQCGAMNITQHALLGVCFNMAFRDVLGTGKISKVICPVDIRLYVPAIQRDQIFAFAPIVTLTTDHAKHATVEAAALQFKQDLKTEMQKLDVEEMLWMAEYFKGSVRGMVNHLKSSKGKHAFTFSNLGRIKLPLKYQHFELEAVHSPIAFFPWRNASTVAVSTFRGMLSMALMSHEACLHQALALQIKNKVNELLDAFAGAYTAPAGMPVSETHQG